jgi:hypothetical protein
MIALDRNVPILLMATRFNNKTWNENVCYRDKIYPNGSGSGCIYSSPTRIANKIPVDASLFVFEMNNETNKIEGIGLIVNRVHFDKYYAIYDYCNYNRFTYKGKLRIDRRDLNNYGDGDALLLLAFFEKILFKGKTHIKRGSGIVSIPPSLLIDEVGQDCCRNWEMKIRHLFKCVHG